ncbi:MAG: insulinase family protein [Rhizobiales bacterium]|nr:insulinase family protein [Hyphomicrobiales bacterium]
MTKSNSRLHFVHPALAQLASKFVAIFAITIALNFAVLNYANATKIERVVSPGGIEAWLVEDHSLPLITFKFAMEGGAAQDPDGKAGLANLVSGLIDEGAGEMDSQAFQGRLQELAISLLFQARRDTFEGSLKTLTEYSEEAFRLLRLALNEPRFDDEPVERIRAQVLTGIRASLQSPNEIASRAWMNIALPGHIYARELNGTIDSVNAITNDDLRGYVARVIAKDRLMISVVGDIDAARLAPLLDQIFGDLPDAATLTDVENATPVAGPVLDIIEMDIPQAIVRFGHAGLARNDPDFIPAYIVNHILGGGSFSSRLYAEIREKRGLAYSVYSYLFPLDHAAFFSGAVATQNERVGETISTLKEEILRMAETGPTEEELASAKSFLIGSYPLRFDTGEKIAEQLIGIQHANLGIEYINNRNGMIDAVTIEDVRRVARDLLMADNLIITIVGRPVGVTEINIDG